MEATLKYNNLQSINELTKVIKSMFTAKEQLK